MVRTRLEPAYHRSRIRRLSQPSHASSLRDYSFIISIRVLSPIARFNTWIASSPLIFADQFVQWSTLLATPLIYGLGEHVAPFLHRVDRWRQLTFWSRDIAPRVGFLAAVKLLNFLIRRDNVIQIMVYFISTKYPLKGVRLIVH